MKKYNWYTRENGELICLRVSKDKTISIVNSSAEIVIATNLKGTYEEALKFAEEKVGKLKPYTFGEDGYGHIQVHE